MYQQVGKTTETNGGYSLSCDQVDRHPIGLELETLSEVIFFFNPSFKKRVKDRKLPTEHVFFFLSSLQSAFFIHARRPVKLQGRPVSWSAAERCILAPFVAPSVMPSSTAERPRLAEGQTLTHSDEFIVV